MANPTTTAPAVNFNSIEWFAAIICYLEVKAICLYFNGGIAFNELEWKVVWPRLLEQLMRNATRRCVIELRNRNLVNSN